MTYQSFIRRRSYFFKNNNKGDEIEELKYKTENHDYKKISKSFKIYSEYYKKENGTLNEKKVFLIISDIWIGTVELLFGSSWVVSGLDPVGIIHASSFSFLSSISTMITIENFRN